jgi:DNA modification methylase
MPAGQRQDVGRVNVDGFNGSAKTSILKERAYADECGKCGARRIDRQIGLEPTPDAYVAELVGVFREVRRVLRRDATAWINIGDSFGPGKQLQGIPWKVAFALQADGWILRMDCIWSKPNPMPESVTDRPTKAHEYLFLLSRSERYYYDADAVAEQGIMTSAGSEQRDTRETHGVGGGNGGINAAKARMKLELATNGFVTRNRRSVWTVATHSFPESHFATFPPALIEPCIKAGTSEKGCCAKCGAPWKRVVERSGEWRADHDRAAKHNGEIYRTNPGGGIAGKNTSRVSATTGWSPSCSCDAGVVPCTVLDPFGGAGTTGLVADRLQRSAIMIELNGDYAEMASGRIAEDRGPLLELMG